MKHGEVNSSEDLLLQNESSSSVHFQGDFKVKQTGSLLKLLPSSVPFDDCSGRKSFDEALTTHSFPPKIQPEFGSGHEKSTGLSTSPKCEYCGTGHSGSYGSGRFCGPACRSRSNAKRHGKQTSNQVISHIARPSNVLNHRLTSQPLKKDVPKTFPAPSLGLCENKIARTENNDIATIVKDPTDSSNFYNKIAFEDKSMETTVLNSKTCSNERSVRADLLSRKKENVDNLIRDTKRRRLHLPSEQIHTILDAPRCCVIELDTDKCHTGTRTEGKIPSRFHGWKDVQPPCYCGTVANLIVSPDGKMADTSRGNGRKKSVNDGYGRYSERCLIGVNLLNSKKTLPLKEPVAICQTCGVNGMPCAMENGMRSRRRI